MKRNLSDYLVALAVIVCSVVLLGALTVALSGFQLEKPRRTVLIDFPDAAGVKVHSEVRFAGARAGKVLSLRHLTPEERAQNPEPKYVVRVTAAIEDDVPPIPADTRVSLGSDTLLSEKFVALSGGTPGSPPLGPDAHLYAGTSLSLDSLLSSLGPVVDDAGGLLKDMRSQIAALLEDVNTLLTVVGKLATDGQGAMIQAKTLLARADKLLKDNEGDIHSRLKELEAVMANLNHVLENADGFVSTTDVELNSRLQELEVVMQNLKVITTHAKAITETLGQRPWRLIWGTRDTKTLQPEQTILESSEPLPATVVEEERPRRAPRTPKRRPADR